MKYRLFEGGALLWSGFILGRDNNLPFAIVLMVVVVMFAWCDMRRPNEQR